MKAEITKDNGRVRVEVAYSALLVDRFRTLPGARFESGAGRKWWSFPAARDVLLMLCDCLGVLPHSLPDELRPLADGGMGGHAQPPPDLSLVEGHVFLTPPYDHQKANLARLLAEPRWLLADEMGCGKSFVVVNRLAAAYRLATLKKSPLPKTLILCPKSVVSVWVSELERHGCLASVVVSGDAAARGKIIRRQDGPQIRIANWEQLIYSENDFLSIPWDYLVGDECHKGKGFTNRTSRVARKLSARADFVYGLSGTPAPNGLEDWLGVLSFIDPAGCPWKTKGEFEAHHVLKARVGGDGPFVVAGYRNTHELHGHVLKVTSRVTKAEALDLPPKVFSYRHVALDGEQARVYRDLRLRAVATLGAMKAGGTLTARNVLTERLKLLQVVGGFVKDDAGAVHEFAKKAKWSALLDAVEEAGGDRIVIWCAFREEVAWIADTLGADAVTLAGDTAAADRKKAIDAFQAGFAKFFVGTAAAGGSGITLHRGATTVYYSRNDNLADYLQSQDRQHRIGQTKAVNVIRLIAQGTVDEKVDQNLERKTSLQDMMLGDVESLV